MSKEPNSVERDTGISEPQDPRELPVSCLEHGKARPTRRPAARRGRAARPQIVLARGLLPVLHEYVSGFLERQGEEVEVGGMLVGEFARTRAGCPVFKLTGFIEAGPGAECSPVSVLFDGDYQARMLQAMRRRERRAGNMGCIHLHPGRMDECSVGDMIGDVQAVRESDTQALVFGIITANNPARNAKSIFFREFKFDFFVMAAQTRFDYVHVRPRLADLPVLQASAGPETLAGAPGVNGAVRHGRHAVGLLADKKRLVAEVRAMEERYGERAILRYRNNRLFWEYTVIESGRHFPIEVRYPRHYPLEPPRIISLLPLPSSPHQLVDNELCWMDRSAHSDWNPARDTAAVCLHAAHRWFACLLVYMTLGEWPEEANDPPPQLP